MGRGLAVAHERKEAGLCFEGKYVQSRRRDTTRCIHRQTGDEGASDSLSGADSEYEFFKGLLPVSGEDDAGGPEKPERLDSDGVITFRQPSGQLCMICMNVFHDIGEPCVCVCVCVCHSTCARGVPLEAGRREGGGMAF